MSDRCRRLSLVKGNHRYVFQYVDGCEPQLVGAFVSLADDPNSEFDWFDAAILSYQMGRDLGQLSAREEVENGQEVGKPGMCARGTWIPG